MSRIVTIDGPSGSGKGTLAIKLAERLGFHFLDSGALYRLLGLKLSLMGDWIRSDLSPTTAQVDQAAQLARSLDIRFQVQNGENQVLLDGEQVGHLIRTEEVGAFASKVAGFPQVREALLDFQRDFYQPPGLIADGRDMGTVVFPDAPVKFYLNADPKIRAERRYDQLREAGKQVNMSAIFEDIVSRDKRDTQRTHAPLKPAVDAVIIDSTALDAKQVFEQALSVCESVLN